MKIRLITLAVAAFAWPAACATAVQAITNVVPNQFTNQRSFQFDSFPFGTFNHLRYQQVYDASQFWAIDPRGGWIRKIGFRIKGGDYYADMPSLQVNLSTTSKRPDQLGLRYADNVGPDETIVFGPAPLDMTWRNVGAVPLTTPFFYSPLRGNLLMDVFNYLGSVEQGGYLEATDEVGDSVSIVLGSTEGERAGDNRTWGLITIFEIVPAPPSPELAAKRSGEAAILRWPTNAVNFVLESTAALLPSNQWAAVTNAPVIEGTNNLVTNSLSGPSKFYRLRFVPDL